MTATDDSIDQACVRTVEGATRTACAGGGPDGTLYSASNDKSIKVWDADGTCVITIKAHRDCVCALALSPDGMLYSGSNDNSIKGWRPISELRQPQGLALAAYDRYFYNMNTVCALALAHDGTLYSASRQDCQT